MTFPASSPGYVQLEALQLDGSFEMTFMFKTAQERGLLFYMFDTPNQVWTNRVVYELSWLAGNTSNILSESTATFGMVQTENTQLLRKGRYPCSMADLLFDWFGFNQTCKYDVNWTSTIESKQITWEAIQWYCKVSEYSLSTGFFLVTGTGQPTFSWS